MNKTSQMKTFGEIHIFYQRSQVQEMTSFTKRKFGFVKKKPNIFYVLSLA